MMPREPIASAARFVHSGPMQGEAVRGGFPDPGFGSLPGVDRARAYLQLFVPRPPLHHLIGLRPSQIGPGSANLTMPASTWHLDIGATFPQVVHMVVSLAIEYLTATS